MGTHARHSCESTLYALLLPAHAHSDRDRPPVLSIHLSGLGVYGRCAAPAASPALWVDHVSRTDTAPRHAPRLLFPCCSCPRLCPLAVLLRPLLRLVQTFVAAHRLCFRAAVCLWAYDLRCFTAFSSPLLTTPMSLSLPMHIFSPFLAFLSPFDARSLTHSYRHGRGKGWGPHLHPSPSE